MSLLEKTIDYSLANGSWAMAALEHGHMNFSNASSLHHHHGYRFNYKLYKRVAAYIHLCFILCGTIGNIIAFGILMRPRIRKYSGMRYLAAICLADITCLYTWNFRLVFREFSGTNIEDLAPFVCRLTALINYASLQISSWLICCIGMDRILTIVARKKNCFTRFLKNTSFVIAFVIITITGINMTVFVKNARPIEDHSNEHRNATEWHNATILHLNVTAGSHVKHSCYKPSSFFQLWDVLHSLMYAFIPFTIILTENLTLTCLAIKHARKMNAQQKSLAAMESPTLNYDYMDERSFFDKIAQCFDKKRRVHRKFVNIHLNDPIPVNKDEEASTSLKHEAPRKISNSNKHKQSAVLHASRRMTKKIKSKGSQVANLLVFLTVSFFLTTVPYSMFYALKLNYKITDLDRKAIYVGILSLVQYCRHGLNFLIYLSTSSLIRTEVKPVFKWLRSKF